MGDGRTKDTAAHQQLLPVDIRYVDNLAMNSTTFSTL
jgi:hypothetical protein